MSHRLSLFEGFGIEIEYMIVERSTLNVFPAADRLLSTVANNLTSDYECGAAAWSNELVNHVIEFKTNGPASSLVGLEGLFQEQVSQANHVLNSMNARLLPTAMHPWMDPYKETILWQHEHNAVYEAFDRIFNCKGHGWANLQSMHINLPFSNDEEFGRLHAAIRLILPILPAIAASSPLVDGKLSGLSDSRLDFYRSNSSRIPSVSGDVIPEAVFDRSSYETTILHRIYQDLTPYDAEGILRYEFSNARGAIARFDRSAIEIRVLDVQESPLMDIAVASLVIGAVRALVEETTLSYDEQKAWDVQPLKSVLLSCIHDGDQAIIDNPAYLSAWGIDAKRLNVLGLWKHIAQYAEPINESVRQAQAQLLDLGCLSRRIIGTLGAQPSHDKIHKVYDELASCLAQGRMFNANAIQ